MSGVILKSSILDEYCAAIGRDPAGIIRSVQLTLDQENPADTRRQAQTFIDAGAGHVVLNLRPPYRAQIVHRAVDEIVEPLTSGRRQP